MSADKARHFCKLLSNIFTGSGSISSGSARSVPRSESRLDSSVGSGVSGGSQSPVQVNGTHVPWSKSSLNNSFRSSGRRSRFSDWNGIFWEKEKVYQKLNKDQRPVSIVNQFTVRWECLPCYFPAYIRKEITLSLILTLS